MASRAVFQSFDPIEQRQIIGKAILSATPKLLISMFRKLFLPPSKFSREFCAVFTTIFFVWLICPCKLNKSNLGSTRSSMTHELKIYNHELSSVLILKVFA